MVVAVAQRHVRRLVAIHEAGHAAMSLALGQGHQEGVCIVASGAMAGFHIVGDQPDLSRLPRFLALREAAKQALVTLAGPMAEAAAQGDCLDVEDFVSAADSSVSDASLLRDVLQEVAQRLGNDDRRARHLAATTFAMLGRNDIDHLIKGIANALIRRGRIGPEALARVHDQWPTDPMLIRLPTTMAEGWTIDS